MTTETCLLHLVAVKKTFLLLGKIALRMTRHGQAGCCQMWCVLYQMGIKKKKMFLTENRYAKQEHNVKIT